MINDAHITDALPISPLRCRNQTVDLDAHIPPLLLESTSSLSLVTLRAICGAALSAL